MKTIVCKKCNKKFAYQLTGAGYPGGKEKETVDCPYCGEVAFSEMTSGIFHYYKIDDEGKIIYKG